MSEEKDVRPSIALHLIRHAESRNNEVYRNARYIYRGGTPEFDEQGWINYVETHRAADPTLSARGFKQSECLANYLVPHLENQASHPVRIIVSPMRRTLETIRPTLEGLQKQSCVHQPKVHIIVCAFYHESEGCHLKDIPGTSLLRAVISDVSSLLKPLAHELATCIEEGMNPDEIRELMKDCIHDASDIEFIGFPDFNRGWYLEGKGAETRAESEVRASKFYLWFCEYLESQLATKDHDLFDAGVQIEGEENEDEHDKHAKRIRRRRTALLVGHGDFMSLVMKRLSAGYGHMIENEGVSHRSAFIHFNTGISELEYFGHGRFLVMGTNHTPHFTPSQYRELRSGGTLRDGWSYVIPQDKFVLNQEVAVAFSDDELGEHVQEQADALKSLYLSSSSGSTAENAGKSRSDLLVAKQQEEANNKLQFVVKRGLQVVGVATYSDETGHATLSDVAIRPSAASNEVGETLIDAVKKHARKYGRSGSLIVHPRSNDSVPMFESFGFQELDDASEEDKKMAIPLG